MIRVLVLIAITGFFVGVVALSSAAAIGGPDLAARNWRWVNHWQDIDWDNIERNHFEDHAGEPGSSSSVTREIAWTGGSELDIEIPADVQFTQAPGPGKVVITGSKRAVERVVLENGRLRIDAMPYSGRRLKVTITAPDVRKFDISGDSELVIEGYKQDSLAIDASGSTEVTVRGATRKLAIDVSGSSELDLSGLDTEAAAVDSSGSAETRLAPKSAANLDISGASQVTLLTKPAQLATDISGAGELHEAN